VFARPQSRVPRTHRYTLVIGVALALLLSACNLIGGEPQELLVLEWSGYETEDFYADFAEANPEVTLDWEYGSSDADILALMQGGSQADVFHFYTGWQQFYVDEGLVAEIDTSQLENWDAVSDEYKEMGQVDGVQYFIPWDIGYTSILYNTEQVDEVTSWAALLDEAYAGHISMWDDGPAAVTVSSYIHGYDETAITEEQLADIEAEWTAQKPLNLHYWDSEYDNLCPEVISGEIWVAYAWQGCYSFALSEGAPVAYATPEEGRNSWAGLYGISAETDSPELALAFLDQKLATLTCSNVVNLYYYGCPRQDVMDAIEDPFIIDVLGLDDPSILEGTNFTPLITPEQRDAWTAMWTRVKAAD
jgi:spermidine/putrescine-binding protein